MTLSQTLPTAVLATNQTPISEDRDVIKGLLESTDQRPAEIHQTIAKYQEEEAVAVTARTLYKCTLSPIRSLPLEVLSEIFLACMDSARFPKMSPGEAPMLLTRICHDFRQLALKIPALWASIYIRFDHIRPRRNQDTEWVIQRGRMPVDVTREWLRRSGKSPLYISFQASRDSFADLINEVIEILLEYTVRWKHISLSFLPNVPLKRLAALTATDVPLLTSLVLHHCGADKHDDYSNWDILRAPKLKHFIIRGDDIASTVFNWSKFTSLGLEPVRTTIQTVIQILLQASNLVKFTLSLTYLADECTNCEIFLPNLELLELESGGRSKWWEPDQQSLLSVIHTPKLVRLSVTTNINKPSIEAFLRRCPNLQQVIALCQVAESIFMPEWLCFCPQITSLTLGLPKFGLYSDTLGYYSEDFVPDDVYFQRWRLQQPMPMPDDVLNLFVEHEENCQVLCPNLHTFICYFPLLTSFEMLCAFLQFQEGAGSLPHRQWKHVGLRAILIDGDETNEGILLDKGHQWPMQFDFKLCSFV